MKGNEGNRELIQENKEITNKLLNHVLGKSAQETQADIESRKQKWEIVGKVGTVLVGSGGILYAIIQAI